MKIIGIGNIVCDIYYKNGNIIGANGGKSWANIIFNLSNMGIKTKVIGNCGNDALGEIALNSLKKANVDITNIRILDATTNLFHINILDDEVITRKRCPICGSKTWHDYPIDLKLTAGNFIIIDSLQYLKALENQIVMMDIGYPNELESMQKDEINYFLKFPFTILNMNNRVAEYLIKKFNLVSLQDLYQKINTKLLIVTKGKKGVTYLFDNKQVDFKLSIIEKEVDPNGAGDIFFASTIKEYIANNFLCSEKLIRKSFQSASSISKEVVKVIGARSYYQELYDIPKTNNRCLCKKN